MLTLYYEDTLGFQPRNKKGVNAGKKSPHLSTRSVQKVSKSPWGIPDDGFLFGDGTKCTHTPVPPSIIFSNFKSPSNIHLSFLKKFSTWKSHFCKIFTVDFCEEKPLSVSKKGDEYTFCSSAAWSLKLQQLSAINSWRSASIKLHIPFLG